MKNIKVVIGSNWGDEGKGLLTDYYASKFNKGIVIRFNGGAQASHSVQLKNGKRHAFQHFGSGTFCGLPSYLSQYFIVNPMVFMAEYNEIFELGYSPETYINKNCIVSTPYDMLINQVLEDARGNDNKHGSCGMGIDETIRRNKNNKFSFTINDVWDENYASEILYKIKNEYVPMRLKELKIDVPENYRKLFNDDNIIKHYLFDIRKTLELSCIVTDKCLKNYNELIFEGAQGLALDQNSKYFPHVTHSNTGIKNVVNILNNIDIKSEEYKLEIIYVTRAYATKHGAGEFIHELKDTQPYSNIIDLTNVPNPYQGTIRYGWLDLDELRLNINKDIKDISNRGINYKCNIAVTCLDQIDNEQAHFIMDNEEIVTSTKDLLKAISRVTKMKVKYCSYGPTRNTISETF